MQVTAVDLGIMMRCARMKRKYSWRVGWFIFFHFNLGFNECSVPHSSCSSRGKLGKKIIINQSGYRNRPGHQSSACARVNPAGDASAHASTPHIHKNVSKKCNICIFKLLITEIHWFSPPLCIFLPDKSAASAYVDLRPLKLPFDNLLKVTAVVFKKRLFSPLWLWQKSKEPNYRKLF